MLRWLYLQLLGAHPAGFRERFRGEMMEAFELARGSAERWQILVDGGVSLFRQWVLRSDFHQPLQPATTAAPVYELITFQQIEPYKPRGIALANGGLLAILVLLGVLNAINHGGGKLRTFVIGMHRPSNGLIKVNRVEGGPLDTTVEADRKSEDPWRPYARSYFRVIRVLTALDADGDLTISETEIANAPDALRKLDLNHDGKLSAEECGFLPPGDAEATADIARFRHEFMSANPVLAALDTDQDSEISTVEIANSPVALRFLDSVIDGKLTPYEILPSQPLSQAAALMSRFDTNDVGLISTQAPSKDDTDAAAIKQILLAADRNHDGVVTRGELIVGLAIHPDPKRTPVQLPPMFQASRPNASGPAR